MDAGLVIGLVLLTPFLTTTAVKGYTTETSASNKPPFSFSCPTFASTNATAVCGSNQEKPFARLDRVDIYNDYTNKYNECLNAKSSELATELSIWFNVECKKRVNERLEEVYRVVLDGIKQAITDNCIVQNPSVTRIVVEFDCVRTLEEVEQVLQPRSRPIISIASTTFPASRDKGDSVAGTTPSKTPSNSKDDTTDEQLLVIILPSVAAVLLIFVISLLYFCCYYRKRREEQRKRRLSAGFSAPRQSAVFLVPTIDSSGAGGGGDFATDDRKMYTAIAYDGPEATSADAAAFDITSQQHVMTDIARRSIDRRSVSLAVAENNSGMHRSSLTSVQQATNSSTLPVTWLIEVPPEMVEGHLGRRHSSTVDRQSTAGVTVYDRRRQSTASVSSSDPLRRGSLEAGGRSGSISTAPNGGPDVESRRLSRSSAVEITGSDRRSSIGSVHTLDRGGLQQQRRVSLVLPASDERRLSDGGGGGNGSRRTSAFGSSSMPGIEEHHELVSSVTATFAAGAGRDVSSSRRRSSAEVAPYRTGGRTLSLDGGAPRASLAPEVAAQYSQKAPFGRRSWSAAERDEAAPSPDVNYSYWPAEWQGWLNGHTSDLAERPNDQ